MEQKVYALNLFTISNKTEYRDYVKASGAHVKRHGGNVVALGSFEQSIVGEIQPRQVMLVVEWESKQAFDNYCNDPQLKELHNHRDKGTKNYIWHLFNKLDDFRSLVKSQA